jgi:hypothetical protein
MPDSPKTVVVTGDVLIEWRLAQSRVRERADNNDALFDPYNYMELFRKPVGSVSVGEIIKRTLAGLPSMSAGGPRPIVLSPPRMSMTDLPYDSPYWHSYAICAQYPRSRDDGDDGDVVWRVKDKLGIDRKNPDSPEHPDRKLTNLVEGDTGDAALVVVEQSHHGFMKHDDAWPLSLKDPNRDDTWLLIEWSRPRFSGDTKFWLDISSEKRFGGRIVVIVTAEDLRLGGMHISRGLSWERTLIDLYTEIGAIWGNPNLDKRSPFQGCAHVIVSFATSGAVLFTLTTEGLHAKLIYDPGHVEESWASNYDGSMSGFTRCLTSGVALEMIRERTHLQALSGEGLKAGVIAARRLLQNGFEAVGRQELADTELPKDLRFPASTIARALRSVVAEKEVIREVTDAARNLRIALEEPHGLDSADTIVERLVRVLKEEDMDTDVLEGEVRRVYDDWLRIKDADAKLLTDEEKEAIPDFDRRACSQLVERILRFIAPDDDAIAMAKVFQERTILPGQDLSGWTILGSVLPSGLDGSAAAGAILSDARKVVEYGDIDRPWPFPTARIGKLFITNSEEMENLSAVRELMSNYMRSRTPNPCSIAVFGSPGSGKSFAINEIAKHLPGENLPKIESRTFNLSQFSGPEAIASALQQVRDDGLSGLMPLVFWDEFDTQLESELGWLRYFLAPMQDGKFQDGSMLHYVGRAIFVFAGGTSVSMRQFLEKQMDETKKSEFSKDAKAAKVPDFVSRLKGFVNVPSLNYFMPGETPGDDRTNDDETKPHQIDAATALRRATMLRSFLADSAGDLEEMVPHKKGGQAEPVLRKRLNVDQSVISAFLRIKRYRYGARSMESIVKMSALGGKNRYDRSSLPPRDQLDLHVDAGRFLKIAKSGTAV